MNRKALARRSFGIGVYALVAAIAIQFFLAGLGIFADARLFFWHTTVDAALIFFGSIALVVLGRFAGLDRGTFGVPGIIAGMVIVQGGPPPATAGRPGPAGRPPGPGRPRPPRRP